MKFSLKTDYPLALDSLDYKYPLGAVKDNSRNPAFNAKLKKFPGSVLDLGCAGGGFVQDCIDEGRIAVGLEGNDYGFKNKWAQWATIPNNLFNCDLTKPYVVHTGNLLPYLFDVITSWEVLEHIEKKDLDQFFENVTRHLAPNGIFVVSISNKTSFSDNTKTIDLHRTHEDEKWWEQKLLDCGLRRIKEIEAYFDKDWIRNERKSFHFVLRHA